MRFRNLEDTSPTYGDLLDENPRVGVQLLNDSRVKVDGSEEYISVPERYFESDREAFINGPFSSSKESFYQSVGDVFQHLSEASPVENPVYRFGKKKSADIDDMEDSEIGFEIWNQEDNHRKSAYGAVLGATGSVAASAGDAKLATALGIAGAGFTAFNSYSRGKRDRTLEKAVEGLEKAYGDYEIRIEEETTRSDKVEKGLEAVRKALSA